MEKFSLDSIVREQAKRAAAAPAGRSAETVYGGHEHTLRQTVLAMTAGTSLTEHENPGEATVQVLRAVDVKPVDRRLGQTAGVLSGRARKGDAVDATVVAIANAGDRIITGDPGDIRALATASGRPILVVPC
jgi:hypothetical protein